MLHTSLSHLNIDWQKLYDKYESLHVDNQRARFFVRRDRLVDYPKYLNSLARAYQKAQAQYENWRKNKLQPVFDALKDLAVNGQVICHAKPTHKYEQYLDHTWWQYTIDNESKMGWGHFFKWIPEPKEKINHELGQKFYELNQNEKYSRRRYILELILKAALEKYLYSLYGYKWLDENQFKDDKLVKFNLRGDQYWYKISHNRNGVPVWENFIWQNQKVEEINL